MQVPFFHFYLFYPRHFRPFPAPTGKSLQCRFLPLCFCVYAAIGLVAHKAVEIQFSGLPAGRCPVPYALHLSLYSKLVAFHPFLEDKIKN